MNKTEIGIEVHSENLLDLPPNCVRCGRETTECLDVKISENNAQAHFAALFGMFGHIIWLTRMLGTKPAKMCCCLNCKSAFLQGRLIALSMFALGGLLTFLVLRSPGQAGTVIEIGLFFTGIGLMFGSLLADKLGLLQSVPVKICRRGNQIQIPFPIRLLYQSGGARHFGAHSHNSSATGSSKVILQAVLEFVAGAPFFSK